MELEETLDDLARFGKPTLIRADRGWWCYIAMHVNATGAKFDVQSESDHMNPLNAALECRSRMLTILGGFGDMKALSKGK